MPSSPWLDGFQKSILPAFLRHLPLPGLAPVIILAITAPALADGRGDWTGYAWKRIDIASCVGQAEYMVCPPDQQRWDWKRNQWVDITIRYNTRTGIVHLLQRLSDNDRRDDDHVCVTALIVDAAGRNLVAHHQNWHMDPLSGQERAYTYHSGRLASASAIHIGSKQCRLGATQVGIFTTGSDPKSAPDPYLPRPWQVWLIKPKFNR